MKKSFGLFFFALIPVSICFCVSFSSSASSPQTETDPPLKISLTYPREGAKIPAVKNSFVFGAVSPPTATVSVNGSTVSVYKTGSYLAMIPFSPGEFNIRVQAQMNHQTAETIRTVFVSSPAMPLPSEPLAIFTESVQPTTNITMTAPDILTLHFKGSPNCQAEYRFRNFKNREGQNEWRTMTEKTSPVAGIYEAEFPLASNDRAEQAQVEYRLTHSSGKSVRAVSSGRIKVMDKNNFTVKEINGEEATFRTGTAIGSDQMAYDLFLPKGTKLRATGQIGNEVRLKFSDFVSGWTDEKNLKSLPKGTFLPRVVLDNIKTQNKERSTLLNFELNERVPYRATVSSDLKLFTLTIFYAISNLDRFSYDAQNKQKWINQIRWFQTSEETVEIQCQLEEKIWGYDLHYDGNKLVCEIFFSPQEAHRSKKKKSPLTGLAVAVDPGHSLETGDGTVSPQGVKEGEINFRIAACLKEKLEKAGAKVFMTRTQNETLPLQERRKRAWQSKADLFVSVHTNAVADGSNPFERRGFSVFYFQPQSFELARLVHEAYKKMVKIPDDGFYYGNLAVCRMTQMPAILTESAYLILPEEEELLLSREFQCLCSDAIVEGIVQFVRSYE